jgi:hypothetical protein
MSYRFLLAGAAATVLVCGCTGSPAPGETDVGDSSYISSGTGGEGSGPSGTGGSGPADNPGAGLPGSDGTGN